MQNTIRRKYIMPTNNFIQFNSNKKDMMNDTEYASNDKVANGVLGGGYKL